MGIVVSYDVSDKNPQMKQKMIDRGYADSWESDGVITYLPNTTLWKSDAAVSQGIADLKASAAALNITLERAVAVPSAPWASIPGKPHK